MGDEGNASQKARKATGKLAGHRVHTATPPVLSGDPVLSCPSFPNPLIVSVSLSSAYGSDWQSFSQISGNFQNAKYELVLSPSREISRNDTLVHYMEISYRDSKAPQIDEQMNNFYSTISMCVIICSLFVPHPMICCSCQYYFTFATICV